MSTETGIPKLDAPFVQENKREPWAARLIAIPWYMLLVELWRRTGGGSGIAPTMVQTGVVQEFAGTTAPTGYLLCDGAAYLVADYPDLFNVIQYTFGGAGASFNVPDRRNRFAIGAGGAIAPNVGDVGGADSSTIAQANLPLYNLTVTDPGHNHTQNAHTHIQDAHNHTQNAHGHTVTDPGHNHTQNSHNHTQNAHTHVQDAHNHTQNAHGHSVTDPGHNHTQNAHNHTQDAHNHTQNSHNHTQDAHDHSSIMKDTAGITSAFPARGTAGNSGTFTIGATTATNQATTATNQAATATNQATTATNNATTTGLTVVNTTATNQAATATNQNTTATNVATTATNIANTTGVTVNNTTATNLAATATNQNTTATNNANTTGISVSSAGGGVALPTLPPYIGMNFIIKT